MQARTHVLGRRVVAHLIDFVVVFGVGVLVFTIVGETTPQPDDSGVWLEYHFNDTYRSLEGAPAALFSLAYIGWLFVVYGLMQGRTGQTPGKMATNIKVVDAEGHPPGIGRSTLRTALWVVDGFPYVIPWFTGFVFAAAQKDRQRVGDLAAGTYVIGVATG